MSAAEALGLPPGVRFDPTGEELVEFYLLPRALGRPPAVPGIIIEDAASSTSACHPWKLLTRHRRTDDDEAYFFEGFAGGDDRAAKGGGARQARGCGSRWTWVAQKRWPDEALLSVPGGEQVSWGKFALNLQERRRKSGSTGWVLHEYTVASPEGAFPVKLCHVAFTGRGQKRQRVPDDGDGDGEGGGQDLEPQAAPPTHKRDATASSVVTTATPDQEDLGGAARAQDQEEQCLSYGTSSVGDFWGSDDAGFSQESSVLNPCYPDAGPGGPGQSQQEPFALDQEPAQNQECSADQSQEQFVNHAGSSVEAYGVLLQASELGSSQAPPPPPAGQSLTEEQQSRLQLAQLVGGIGSPSYPPTAPAGAPEAAAYHEELIQTTADLPLPTDQESCTTERMDGNMGQDGHFFVEWSDIERFWDTTGVQAGDGVATGILAGAGHVNGVGATGVADAKSRVKYDLDRRFLY